MGDEGVCVPEVECGCAVEMFDPVTGRDVLLLGSGEVFENECHRW